MKKITIVTLAFSWCVYAQAGERLSSEDLKAFYTGNTIIGEHFKLGPGRAYYSEDGSVHSKSDSGQERIGKWWVDESSNKRCIRWNDKNKNFCHYTEKNDDGTHSLIHAKNGKELVKLKEVKEGNHL